MLYKTAVDACTLIYLSKTKLIERVSKSFQLHTSNKVLEEVVKMGKERLYKDAYYAEEMMEMGKISPLREDKIKTNKIRETFNLEEGEASTLAIHHQYGLDIVASDENKVQNICDALGIPFTYALAMFTHCCLDGEISKDEISRYFWDLVDAGGYSLGIVEMTKKILEERVEVKL